MTPPAYNAEMSWLHSSSPALLPARQARRVRATLAAWLLVLVAGLFAPWAQARNLEPVCSGSGHTRWMFGPEADGLAHAMHGLDCPLCMPQLAAPPATQAATPAPLPNAGQPERLPTTAWAPLPSACPPPARGPPV